ncbi:MAG: carbohydrate porin [Burkholderiales bacterium]|nr:carbohydrate porin [Burkholderiales bacterium]
MSFPHRIGKPILALSMALTGTVCHGTGNADTKALLEEFRKLNERMEKLEQRNRLLEQQLTESKEAAQRVKALEETQAQTDKALQTNRLSEKEPELVTRIKAVEFQTLSMQKQARQIEALEGISVGASLTGVYQHTTAGATAAGQRESRINYRGDVSVSLPGGSMGDIDGKIFAHFRFGQGNGIGLKPTYTSTPNTTAFQVQSTNPNPDDSFGILAQAWYQLSIPLPRGGFKPHSKQRLELNFGKMDPFVFFDQNAIADDESTRFLNNAFVHNPLLDSGGDVGADAYGFAPGVRMAYVSEIQKRETWGASLGVFGAGRGANFSGSFGQPFVIAQLETSRKLWSGLPGNYRAYVWRNAQGGDYDGGASVHAGLGFSIDQKIGDHTTAFARYGHQFSGMVRFDRALTGGVEIGGSGWGRSADALGFALGYLRTSSSYRTDSSTLDLDGDGVLDPPASGGERIAELYYRYRVNDRFEVSPDLQWISRPAGNGTTSPITVIGLRARIGF